jgi:hypothetical protein
MAYQGLQDARAQEFSKLFFHFGTPAVVLARLGTPFLDEWQR